MTRRTQRIAELMHARDRIDAQLANLGYFPAPDAISLAQDWQESARQILAVLAISGVEHVKHYAVPHDDPEQQAERRSVLEDATRWKKAS
jgi:hypothetical protein